MPKTYSLAHVLKHGINIKVSCDGPARFFTSLDFPAMTKQSRDISHLMGHTALPAIAQSRDVKLTRAGTASTHQKLVKVASRVAKNYRKSKVLVILVVEREDGAMWSEPGLNKRTVLVR